MTAVTYSLVRGHYYLPVRIWTQQGKSEPVVALMGTGATKCSIPSSMNDSLFHFPTIGHDANVITASAPEGYDVVRIPLMNLIRILALGSNNFRLEDTDLQENNVEAWLGNRYTLGMNWIRKFTITLPRNDSIIVER